MPDFDAEVDGDLVHYQTGEHQPCYQCGQPLDVATQMVGHAQPDAGAVSICFYCGAVALFTGNGFELRQPAPDERRKMLGNPRVFRAVAEIMARNETSG